MRYPRDYGPQRRHLSAATNCAAAVRFSLGSIFPTENLASAILHLTFDNLQEFSLRRSRSAKPVRDFVQLNHLNQNKYNDR